MATINNAGEVVYGNDSAIHNCELPGKAKGTPGRKKDAFSTKQQGISLTPSLWAYVKTFAYAEELKPGTEDALTGEGEAFNASQAVTRALDEARRFRPAGESSTRKRGARGRFVSESGKMRARAQERPQLLAEIAALKSRLAKYEGSEE